MLIITEFYDYKSFNLKLLVFIITSIRQNLMYTMIG